MDERYRIIRKDKDLKVHHDFNWNDRLRLYRKLTCFLFLNPGWKESWGGHQQYWESRDGEMIDEVSPMFNRFIMFENKKELNICVVEKGSEVGAHILSGAVLETRALDELIPDWKNKESPLKTEAKKDNFFLFTKNKSFK